MPKLSTAKANHADLAQTERTLSIALLRSREAVMDRFRPMLKTHGVTEQQWRVMRVLSEAGPCDASQLAQMACVLSPASLKLWKLAVLLKP